MKSYEIVSTHREPHAQQTFKEVSGNNIVSVETTDAKFETAYLLKPRKPGTARIAAFTNHHIPNRNGDGEKTTFTPTNKPAWRVYDIMSRFIRKIDMLS